MRLAVSVAMTALLSFILTYLVRAESLRRGLVAAPRKDRWHREPTALMGGIAIYLSFLIGLIGLVGFAAITGNDVFPQSLWQAYPILFAGTLLFFVGVYDDLWQIKPYTKLVMQLVAASIVVYGGFYLPWTSIPMIDYVITTFWLIGITNAVNLLDNMDGLAGGIALIACVFLAITLLLNGQTAEAAWPLMLAAAIAGFLYYNFNPASIFMGDCGSMFLGFMLGGTALLSDMWRTRNISAVLLTPVLIFMIPIFDTSVVTVTRKLSGRPVSQGGRDHTSHRLVALGISERRAVLMLYLFATLSGAMALLVRQMRIEVTLFLIAGLALTILFLGLYLGMVRIYDEGKESTGTLVDVLNGFTHRRRFFEIMLDFCLVILAYYCAFLLRFDGEIPKEQISILIKTLPLVIAIQIFTFLPGGLYRGIWRYVGVDDLIVIGRSVFIGALVSGLTVMQLYSFHGPSRGALVIYGVLLLLFLCASRLSFRLLGAMIIGRRPVSPDMRPVIIYGAGDGGEILIRELLNNPAHRYQPVGFIDDDTSKKGKLLRGYRIFSSDDLPDLINEHGVCDVLISSLKVPESKLDKLRGLGVAFKRLRIQIE